MPISLPLIADLVAAILGTALLVHAGNKALRWFIDRAPTTLDIPVDVDPLSPEPFVDAHETLLPTKDTAAMPRCRRCGSPMSIQPCWVCDCSSNDRSAA